MRTATNIAAVMVMDLMGSFGWLGDEIGFVFIMVLWAFITVYLAWNVNKEAFEFETDKTPKKSGNLEFFICFGDTPHLDGQYTVWGEVIEGMEFVDMIKKGDPIKNGMVDDPDKIIKMWIE